MNRWRKLPPEMVEAIRQAAAEGLSISAIGRRLGLAHAVTSRVMRRHGITINPDAPRAPRAPRSAPKPKPKAHACEYHDCQMPLPEPGVCRPGLGNPSCVARGPRITWHGPAPWGWEVDRRMIATPEPDKLPILERFVELVEAGLSSHQVAAALRWRPRDVEQRRAFMPQMVREWRAIEDRKIAA